VPEATALPYGPWLALAALEIALLGPWLAASFPSPLVALLTGQPWVPPP
jgi:leader peptidase (prepilin peptidase)/N-methyltransferase